MIRFKCNGEPFIDPLHKFTADDWEVGEETESGQAITDIISKAAHTEPLTIETMMAAIEKLKYPDYSNNASCFDNYKVQECAWMKGMEVVVLCGDKAYCWPDSIVGKSVKVIWLPELEPITPELNWEF